MLEARGKAQEEKEKRAEHLESLCQGLSLEQKAGAHSLRRI